MLKAHGEFILPDNVPANEFMNLENDKISTSKNWAIWINDYLKDFEGKEDVLRFVLCANAPEAKDSEFTWKDYQARNNNELVAILGNFVNRTLVLIHKYYEGKCPPPSSLNKIDEKTLIDLKNFPEIIGNCIEKFRFRDALSELMNLARLGNKYLADSEPWKEIKTNPKHVKTVLNISLQITGALSVLMEPFLPFTSKKLKNILSIGEMKWNDASRNNLIPDNHLLNNPELLFEKIEDEVIEKQILKLASSKKTYLNNLPEKEKKSITFDSFSQMDIRIATIVDAQKIAKTNKLLLLKVDTGKEIRTIVSGIAEHFQPEEIIGKQVTVLLNLESKKIKGIDSQGMILMAEDKQGKLEFVSPQKEIEKGSVVK